MALAGEVPLDELYDYADNALKDRLTVIGGVAEVQLIGGARREVHVVLDRDQLAARGLTSTNVVSVIEAGVRTIPSGRLRESGTEYSVKFDADYDEVERIGGLEVANANGQRCYLRDVGHVEMSTEELRQAATMDSEPCIAIKVVKKSDANAVAVVQRVRAALDELNAELPGGMRLVWITDDGVFTEATVNSAWINVGQGILLTAAVLFLLSIQPACVAGRHDHDAADDYHRPVLHADGRLHAEYVDADCDRHVDRCAGYQFDRRAGGDRQNV